MDQVKAMQRMMTEKEITAWLLEGDVSIQFQTCRDLLGSNKPSLQRKIVAQGWGREFLKRRHRDGHWGRGFYQPKWTSTHYTLLDLKNLGISPDVQPIRESILQVLTIEKGKDGGVNPHARLEESDVCINGMAMNYACYFGIDEAYLHSVVDFILSQKMADGGFNCQSNRKGAAHSSLHTTLSILEGILEYERHGYGYRLNELLRAKKQSEEFILMHKLFRSDKSGEVINPKFLTFCYPGRWYYNVLKAMDYFQSAGVKYDQRMDDAIDEILKKRTREGLWKLPAHHPGEMHFDMEQPGKPSRWNTLRALRVLKHYHVL